MAQHKEYTEQYCNKECMGIDGSSISGEHRIMYKIVELLCCTPETNVIFCVNYTTKKSMISIHQLKGRDYRSRGRAERERE